ncbi:MAG: hypothetical protein RMN51_13505 [Verrucomicrobiota bacterium]|nr:hypothetical protein [Verrucomicrobiota bacterium]
MNEPWFDPGFYGWIPGTVLGVLGGGWGSLAGVLAPRGQAKLLIMGLWWVLMTAAVILLLAGIIAWVLSQPYGVWGSLGLPGFIGVLVLGPLWFVMCLRYREAEGLRMTAKDL